MGVACVQEAVQCSSWTFMSDSEAGMASSAPGFASRLERSLGPVFTEELTCELSGKMNRILPPNNERIL